MMRWMTPDDRRRAARLSTAAAVAGVLFMAIAAVGTVQRWLPDLASTVLGILGVVGLIYGLATGIRVVLEREPDE